MFALGKRCPVPEKLKVLFFAAEAEPFIKIGGLGEVAGSLTRALNTLSESSQQSKFGPVEVRLALPFHGNVQQQNLSLRLEKKFGIHFLGEERPTEVLSCERDGLYVYFIHSPLIPAEESVYSSDPAKDALKYTFFSLAALHLSKELDWLPQVVHLNDWHTALTAYIMRFDPRFAPLFQQTAVLISLHNLPYLGAKLSSLFEGLQLPRPDIPDLPAWARDMPLPLGLYAADHIVPVSPTYAREILTPVHGCGLEGFLRQHRHKITGILNGLDEARWNPATDAFIEQNYDEAHLELKKENKRALQEEFGLPDVSHIPMMGVVSRLDMQKGIDLIPSILPHLSPQGDSAWQLVVLGTGDAQIEKEMQALEARYPQQVRVALRFDRALSHRIFAGADMLLIPSRYEPCGLTQMIAMRYGCVPIAHAVGGLKDTILDDGDGGGQNGYLFHRFTPSAFLRAIRRALRDYAQAEHWRRIQKNGMSRDFSWRASARKYLELYHALYGVRQKA